MYPPDLSTLFGFVKSPVPRGSQDWWRRRWILRCRGGRKGWTSHRAPEMDDEWTMNGGNDESRDLGMDQYLLIPFLEGWTSIYQLFWCSPGVQGFDPYSQTKPCFEDLINLIFFATGNKVIERQQNSGSEPNQSLLSRGAVGKLESARIHRLLWTWNPSLGGAAKLTCCDTCRGGRVPSALGPFRAQHYDQGGGNTLAKNISGG